MAILILSVPADLHSSVVQWSLAAAGVKSSLFIFPDFPDKLHFSWRISSFQQRSLDWQGLSNSDSLDDYSVVWSRRVYSASVPADAHQSDRKHIEYHNTLAVRWLKKELLSNSLAINSVLGQENAASKINQLTAARDAGLEIPDTLFSNDKDSILEFQNRYPEVIAKPISHVYFEKPDGGLFQSLTTILPQVRDLDARSFSYMPYLFQPLLRKRSDVRVFVLGKNLFAVEIMSQTMAETSVDFRARPATLLPHRRIAPPEHVRSAILEFMSRTDLVFGQFDFVLDQEGKWIFIEVNEQGNWLWLELMVPDLPLVDCLTKFLIEADPEFEYCEEQIDFSFARFRKNVDFDEYVRVEQAKHNGFDPLGKTLEVP